MLTPGLPNCTHFVVAPPDELSAIRQATMLVWKVGMPLVILLGTFGNIMILLIQQREYSTSHSTMSIFFICLAISDLTSLWFDPFFRVLEVFDINVYSKFILKMRVFVSYFTGHISASILVSMTAQKAASILWPHKVNILFTRRFAKSLISCISTFFLMLNSHLFYGITVNLPSCNTTVVCFDLYDSIEYAAFYLNVWGWIDTFFSSFAPSVLLVVANSVLIWKVSQSVQEARKYFLGGNSDRLRTREKKTSSMTITLITTSIAFLLFTSPLSVYFIFMDKFSEDADSDQNIADSNDLAYAVLHLLWIANNAVTFYLYCLTGAKYREKFFKLIYIHKDKHFKKSPLTKRVPVRKELQGPLNVSR